MTARAAAIARGEARELVWLLEHPALYTAGTSARPHELIEARFPVHTAGRGGQFTYHGPGQRVGYVMLDLKRRAPDVRRFVATIEQWIIRTLAAFYVRGERRDDRIGVWVRRPDKGEGSEDKIAAIGIRVRHWVTLHGFALNVEPDLSHFSGIVPCGVADPRYGVTSLADLGMPVSMPEVDIVLRAEFEPLFGATADAQMFASTENNSSGRRSANSSHRPRADRQSPPARPAGRRGTVRSWSAPLPPDPPTPPRPNRRGNCAPSPRRRAPARSLRPRRESRRPAPGRGRRPERSRPSVFLKTAPGHPARALRQKAPQICNVRRRQLPLQRRCDQKLHVAGLRAVRPAVAAQYR